MFHFFKDNVTKAYDEIMKLRGAELNVSNIELIISDYNFSKNQLEDLLYRLGKQGIDIEMDLEESDQYDSYDELYDEYDEEELDDLEE